MAFSVFGWQKSYSSYMFWIFYVDNTVLGVTTESKEREREKKTGYYLCKELSKDSTAKWWILYFVTLWLHWLMTIFVFLIKGTPTPLESVYIFQTPRFTSNIFGGPPKFSSVPPPPPNKFLRTLPNLTLFGKWLRHLSWYKTPNKILSCLV